jgi:hypothetical protein
MHVRRTTILTAAALGLALGTVWGVLARIWMRLISDDPEFSWTGTLLIVGFSALLGLGVGLAHAGRSRWWTLAVAPGLILFLSPGMVMFPALLLGGPAFGVRGRVLRVVGYLALLGTQALALYMVLALPEPGAEDPTFGDVLVFSGGFAALTLALAWASSLVWQRKASAVQRRPLGADGGVVAVAGVHDRLVGQREEA